MDTLVKKTIDELIALEQIQIPIDKKKQQYIVKTYQQLQDDYYMYFNNEDYQNEHTFLM